MGKGIEIMVVEGNSKRLGNLSKRNLINLIGTSIQEINHIINNSSGRENEIENFLVGVFGQGKTEANLKGAKKSLRKTIKERPENVFALVEDKDEKLISRHIEKIIKYEYKNHIKTYNYKERERGELIEKFKKEFQVLGNGQFMFVKSAKFQEEINQKFEKEELPKITKEITVNALKENQLLNVKETMSNICRAIDDVMEFECEKKFRDFFKSYTRKVLQTATERKQPKPIVKKEKKKDVVPINKEIPKKESIEENDTPIKIFLEGIFQTQKNKKEIISHMIRFYRNNKIIKIEEFAQRYRFPATLFTSKEIEEKAKALGILIEIPEANEKKEVSKISTELVKTLKKENNGITKNGTIEEKVTKEEDVEPIEKTKEECIQTKIQKYLEKHKEWDGKVCTEILSMAGYTPNKDFIKQFTLLYPNTHMQKKVIEELTKEITKLHRKTNKANGKTYRSINFRTDHRILFLTENIIDGIYNHNDYMRRLSNQSS